MHRSLLPTALTAANRLRPQDGVPGINQLGFNLVQLNYGLATYSIIYAACYRVAGLNITAAKYLFCLNLDQVILLVWPTRKYHINV